MTPEPPPSLRDPCPGALRPTPRSTRNRAQTKAPPAMNEITLHGNVTAEPVRRSNTGRIATSFSVAVNNGYYDRRSGQYVTQPAVFHHVVCFGDLADNAAATLRKGATVTVTGQFTDDSYQAEGGQRIRRTRLVAADVAVSLRWATAA